MLSERVKKYRLTDERIEFDGRILFRIEALRNFGIVQKGELGGFVESEKNLSHAGDCWLFQNTKACKKAWICENGRMFDESSATGSAKLFGSGVLSGQAKISSSDRIGGLARVSKQATVRGNVEITSRILLTGNALVESDTDYMSVSPWIGSQDVLSVYRSANGVLECSTLGCDMPLDAYARKVAEWSTPHLRKYAVGMLGLIRERMEGSI
jgi:hypothetical protein